MVSLNGRCFVLRMECAAQFGFVQAELARREQNGRYSGVSIFSNKIKCGCCGGWYGSKVWHYHSGFGWNHPDW